MCLGKGPRGKGCSGVTIGAENLFLLESIFQALCVCQRSLWKRWFVLVLRSHGNHGMVTAGSRQEGQQLEMSGGLPAAGMEMAELCLFT